MLWSGLSCPQLPRERDHGPAGVQVYGFPPGAASLLAHPRWFLALGACGLATSFTSTLMFTSLGAFFNKISDPAMGGAYLTLLNTIANMGATDASRVPVPQCCPPFSPVFDVRLRPACNAGVVLPKLGIFWLVDVLTLRECKGPAGLLVAHACPGRPPSALHESVGCGVGHKAQPPFQLRRWCITRVHGAPALQHQVASEVVLAPRAEVLPSGLEAPRPCKADFHSVMHDGAQRRAHGCC